MQLRNVFARDVTREIPPVVYFHEQDPAVVAGEVAEYIITGGFAENDPRHRRVPRGIHEALVKLLENLRAELARTGGPTLPASWISGFYGSGKSSFAKLLGLALDGLTLPGERPLAAALLERDDSPRRERLHTAWRELTSRIEPIAVVFDVGSAAREGEHVAAVALRQLQRRLGYCPQSHHVAEHELKLEIEGMLGDLDRLAREHLHKPWVELAKTQLAEEHFSLLLSHLLPDHYTEPMSWLDAHAGARTGAGTSIEEITRAIAEMLERRAKGKTLFFVIDEVSQYIHQHDDRQLRLQTFVENLGQRLKGRAWLLCTGQQQLEDSEDAGNIGKLKDRFPAALRVHLEPSNIRDVVHKRLLRKNPLQEAPLRALFAEHKHDLRLNAYRCDNITEEDFVEVYPLLPEHVDLFLRITSNLRLRSSRVKGDDYAIRGLLQTLGEMFREQKLGERELGELVTLDAIYDVHHTAFDVDTKNAMDRLGNHETVGDDELALAAAKAVALLQLVQEQMPTTPELVAQCLYPRLGAGNRTAAVISALERLREHGLLAYSEKHGYKLQSTAGQEWLLERDKYHVTGDRISQTVLKLLHELFANVSPARLRDRPFPWVATYTDEHGRQDERLVRSNDSAVIRVAFHYVTTTERREENLWRPTSDTAPYRDRLLWIAGELGELPVLARALVRSYTIVERYLPRISSLPPEKQRCVFEEQSHSDELEGKVREAVGRAFLAGGLYFRGRRLEHQRWGESFAGVLETAGAEILPVLYNQFVNAAITPAELAQLLQTEINGPSPKLTDKGLGLLELDQGAWVPSCKGEVPTRIRQRIDQAGGASGDQLLAIFGGPPYGYSEDVIKASLAALLRSHQVRFRLDTGEEVGSYRDEGASGLFQSDRSFKRADVLPAGERKLSARDRGRIIQLLRDRLLLTKVGREDEQLADNVFVEFRRQMERLRNLQKRFDRLPGRPPLPARLSELERALEASARSRRIEDTLGTVKQHLEALSEGFDLLGRLDSELSEDAIEAVREVATARHQHATQLLAAGELDEHDADWLMVREQLEHESPWREVLPARQAAARLAERYRQARRTIVDEHERAAEQSRRRLKRREGWSELTADRQGHVLTPIAEALPGTESGREDAVVPGLVELRDGVATALVRAEVEAGRRLDHALAVVTGTEVVTFELELAGKEIKTREDVEVLVATLRERLLAQLDAGGRVRIRLV